MNWAVHALERQRIKSRGTIHQQIKNGNNVRVSFRSRERNRVRIEESHFNSQNERDYLTILSHLSRLRIAIYLPSLSDRE